MPKIGQRIEELREAFAREYGLDVKVNISAYDTANDVNPVEAQAILKSLLRDHGVTGNIRIYKNRSSHDGRKFGWAEIDNDCSNIAIFSRPKEGGEQQ